MKPYRDHFAPGNRVVAPLIHLGVAPSGDAGTLVRQSPGGTVGGDWFVVWDHDPEHRERLTWSHNLKRGTEDGQDVLDFGPAPEPQAEQQSLLGDDGDATMVRRTEREAGS